MIYRILFFSFISVVLFSSCKEEGIDRVERSKKLKARKLTRQFKKVGIDQYEFEMFVKVFKLEQAVQVMVRAKGSDDEFQAVSRFAFCKISGVLGPKRKENDLQIPEGLYHIDRFNPKSKFYLSLGLNYPNASDKILGDNENPGSDIFIHGGCSTTGCIPISDSWIGELYIMAERAKKAGQSKIPVYIFPYLMVDERHEEFIEKHPHHEKFWTNLKTAFEVIHETNKPINFSVAKNGDYIVKQ